MFKLKTIITFVFILLVTSLTGNAIAVPVEWYEGDYEIRSDNEWYHIIELQIYNDVTVKMFIGTSVNSFSMYNNSDLTMFDGTIHNLYLYGDSSVSLLGGYIPILEVKPGYNSKVKLYADFDRFEPYSPFGEGTVYGNWLSNGDPFNINLVGNGAYSHIQFVPEPATVILLGIGILALRHRK